MTLTEFLGARLDEDEAIPWRIVPYSCEPGCCAPAGWVGHQCLICDVTPTYGGTVEAITEIAREHDEQIHQRARALREVEAKRRVIELAILPEHQSWTSSWVDALVALGSVYSDHPDYRQVWAQMWENA